MEEQKKVTLDAREVRKNLHPQNVAMLLASFTGSLSRVAQPQSIAAACELVLSSVRHELAKYRGLDQPYDPSLLTSAECAVMLVEWIGSMGMVAELTEVRKAVEWFGAKDDAFWKDIEDRLRKSIQAGVQSTDGVISA